MNTIYNLSPLQQAPGRCSIFIPEIGTVELILNAEEVQPFHTRKNRSIDDKVLVGLRVAKSKCVHILAEHDRFASGPINSLICELSVEFPYRKI